MTFIVTNCDDIVGPWVCQRAGGTWVKGRGTTIGLCNKDGELIAGVLYEDYNKANLIMHVAAIPGGRWLTREFLHVAFSYPFEQLGVSRVTGVVPSENLAARKFDEHLGFELEATLTGAHPGGDLLIYVMRKEHCRWLSLRNNHG